MRRAATLVSLLALLVSTRAALSDGMFMPPKLSPRVAGQTGVASTAQKAVIIDMLQGQEILLLQTTYQGPAEEFAWVIPVPGLPGKNDVFPASPEFLDVVFGQTTPRIRTTMDDPVPCVSFAGGSGFAGSLLRTAGFGGHKAEVVVHQRMKVGMYDAAVLSATGAGVLTHWLLDNGFQVPQDATEILATYVEKSWYFVALRIIPDEIPASALVEDVDPIGIRFETDRLVFPLTISRASSREETEILLVIMADTAVRCDQLPSVSLPLGQTFDPGESYATIRRAALQTGGPGVIVEYTGGQPMPYRDMDFVRDLRRPMHKRGLTALQGTRLWTVLDNRQMEDLTFSPTQVERGAVEVTRYALVRRGWSTWLLHSTPGVILLLACFGALLFLLISVIDIGQAAFTPKQTRTILWTALLFMVLNWLICPIGFAVIPFVLLGFAAEARATHKPGTPMATARRPTCYDTRWLLGTLGFFVIGLTAIACLLTPGPFFEDDYLGRRMAVLLTGHMAAIPALIVIAALIAWVWQVCIALRPALGDRSFLWRATPLAAIALALVWVALAPAYRSEVFLPMRGFMAPAFLMGTLGTAAVAVATVAWAALVGVLVQIPSAPERVQKQAKLLAITTVFVIVTMFLTELAIPPLDEAHAGTLSRRRASYKTLDKALTELDDAMLAFVEDHGCYPAKLADLTAAAKPDHGVDASGNRVKLAGTWVRSYVSDLPVDPLTKRRDTWVYEPTGSPMVDSGGYTILVTQEEPLYQEMRQPFYRSYGEWSDRPVDEPLRYYPEAD